MQPTLLIINQVAVRYILMRNMLNEPIRNYPKDVYQNRSLLKNFEITKNNKKLYYVCYIETTF